MISKNIGLSQFIIMWFCKALRILPVRGYLFCRYKYPYNINYEQNQTYLKKVEKAQKSLTELQIQSVIPRRKRRVYDRPRIDTNIESYAVWRVCAFGDGFDKSWEHQSPVVIRFQLQPKWVIHAFGQGMIPINPARSTHREYSFEDNNLSMYFLYEYRNTTAFKPNIADYDYDNQENIYPKQRKIRRLNPQQFWQSQEYHQFRVNATAYAQHHKFKNWLLTAIETRKNQESYDQFIDKKFGTAYTFNQKSQMDRFQPAEPAIINISPNHFSSTAKVDSIPKPTVNLPKRLSKEHAISKQRLSEMLAEFTASSEDSSTNVI